MIWHVKVFSQYQPVVDFYTDGTERGMGHGILNSVGPHYWVGLSKCFHEMVEGNHVNELGGLHTYRDGNDKFTIEITAHKLWTE